MSGKDTKKRTRAPDDNQENEAKKRRGHVVVSHWDPHGDIPLRDIVEVIEGSGEQMEVPYEVVEDLHGGKVKALTLVSDDTLVGALIYGTFEAGSPEGMYPYPQHTRSELYFVGVSVKGAGSGGALLSFWERQAQLDGAELLQVVLAKQHLIGTFYKGYQIDKQLEGAAFISKWVENVPDVAPGKDNTVEEDVARQASLGGSQGPTSDLPPVAVTALVDKEETGSPVTGQSSQVGRSPEKRASVDGGQTLQEWEEDVESPSEQRELENQLEPPTAVDGGPDTPGAAESGVATNTGQHFTDWFQEDHSVSQVVASSALTEQETVTLADSGLYWPWENCVWTNWHPAESSQSTQELEEGSGKDAVSQPSALFFNLDF